MPTPRSGESEKDFVARCIPIAKKEDPSLSDKEAAGKCGGIYRQHHKKAVSLEERAQRVRTDWDASYGNEPPFLYAWFVYDDYIVCSYRGRYIRIDYELVGGVAQFAEPEDWTLVDMDWAAAKELTVVRRVGRSPVRAVEGRDDLFRVQVVRFGSPKDLDLEGTYFTADTKYHLDWFKTRPWLYHHGMHPDMGVVKIGEWGAYETTEEGVFFEGELAAAFKYREAVQDLIREEALYPSTGALGYLVKCAKDGWMEEWPIVEASSTATPAEFRLAAIKPSVVKALKALEGGIVMSEPRGGVRAALERLFGLKSADEPVTPEESPSVPASEPVEAEEASSTPEEVPEEEASDTPDVISERAAEIDALVKNQTQLIEAVLAISEAVEQQAGDIKAIASRVEALGQSQVEQVKAAIQDEGWFNNVKLHLQSRDGTPEKSDAPSPQPGGNESGGSPYLAIRQAQGLVEA